MEVVNLDQNLTRVFNKIVGRGVARQKPMDEVELINQVEALGSAALTNIVLKIQPGGHDRIGNDVWANPTGIYSTNEKDLLIKAGREMGIPIENFPEGGEYILRGEKYRILPGEVLLRFGPIKLEDLIRLENRARELGNGSFTRSWRGLDSALQEWKDLHEEDGEKY